MPRSNQHVSRIRSIPIPVFDIACKPPEEDYAHAQAEVDDHEQTVIGSEGIRNSNVQKIQGSDWECCREIIARIGRPYSTTMRQISLATTCCTKRLTNKTATQKPLQDIICRLSL